MGGRDFTIRSTPWWPTTAGVAVVYFVCAWLGMKLAFEQTNVTPVWPPAGIAFAAVMLFGARIWPGIALGAILANVVGFLGDGTASVGTAVVASLLISTGCVLEPVLGGALFRRWVAPEFRLDRAQVAIVFVLVAVLMCFINCVLGPTIICLSGLASWVHFATMVFTWWIGDLAGVLVIAPLVIYLIRWRESSTVKYTLPKAVELCSVCIAFVLIWRLEFDSGVGVEVIGSSTYLILPALVWVAARFGYRESAIATGLVAATVVWGTLKGRGPFVGDSQNTSLMLMQGFVCVAAVSSLVIAAGVNGRRFAEEALRQSEQRYRSVVEDVPGLICRFLPTTEIAFINRAYCEYFGMQEEELVGKSFLSLIPEDEQDVVVRDIESLCLESPVCTHTHRVRLPNGELRWQRWTDRALFDKQGRIVGYQASGEDVTESRNAERKLRASERQYRELFNNMTSGVAVYEVQDNGNRFIMTDLNDAGRRVTDLDGVDVIGKNVVDLFPGVEKFGLLKIFRDVWLSGNPQHLPIKQYVDARLTAWFDNYVYRLPSGNIVAVFDDVTAERCSEEALRHSEERFRNLFEHSSDGILLLGLDGTILDANRKVLDLFEYSKEELLSLSLPALQPGSARRSIGSLLEDVEHRETLTVETEFSRKSSEVFHGQVTGVAMEISGRRVVHVVIKDVTDERNAEQERIRLEADLRHAQRLDAVGQLAAGVAHDFNNLLTAITGYSTLARNTLPESHRARALLAEMEDAAGQAAGVTRALLTFSHKTVSEKAVVCLNDIIEKAIKLFRRVLPASVEVVTDVNAEPVWVLADGLQLQQVLMNLAINARDAMSRGGRLTIGLRCESAIEDPALRCVGVHDTCDNSTDKVARITVSDTGEGMPSDVMDRVFEPFFTTKPREQGTGLGLAIIHGIVRDHNGSVDVESTPGKGTTFTVLLPALREEETSLAEDSTPASRRGLGETVLLAEDNRHVRGIIASALESYGYQVLEAADGEAMMSEFRRNAQRVGILIVDVDLPKRNGLECLNELRDNGVELPAIVITGSAEVSFDSSLDARTVLLRKPFQIGQLNSLVGNMLSEKARREVHREPEDLASAR